MSYQLNTRYPSRQIHCSSQWGQALTSTLGSELYFAFQEMLVDVPDTIDVLIGVVSATIPYSWPNISVSQMNNAFAYMVAESVIPRLIVVPDGYWNIQELVAFLNNSPQFQQDALTATYERPTGIVSISRAAVATVSLYGISIGATLPWCPLTNCYLAGALGFNMNAFVLATLVTSFFTSQGTATTWTGTTPVDLMPTQSVWIESDFMTDSFDSREGGRTPVLARVPVTGVPGTFIQWQNITGQRVRIHQKQLGSQVMLRMTDDNRNLIDFRGRPWCVTLQVDFVHALDEADMTREALAGLNVFGNNIRTG